MAVEKYSICFWANAQHTNPHISSSAVWYQPNTTENYVPFGSECLILIHRFQADKALWSPIWVFSNVPWFWEGFLIWTPKMHHKNMPVFWLSISRFCFYTFISIWYFHLMFVFLFANVVDQTFGFIHSTVELTMANGFDDFYYW